MRDAGVHGLERGTVRSTKPVAHLTHSAPGSRVGGVVLGDLGRLGITMVEVEAMPQAGQFAPFTGADEGLVVALLTFEVIRPETIRGHEANAPNVPVGRESQVRWMIKTSRSLPNAIHGDGCRKYPHLPLSVSFPSVARNL